jgi:hypothetical protein
LDRRDTGLDIYSNCATAKEYLALTVPCYALQDEQFGRMVRFPRRR